MKKIVLGFLTSYQKYLSPGLHHVLGIKYGCKYSPTCSEYARIHIEKDGVVKGGLKSLLRLLLCQPFVEELPIFLRK